MQRSRRTTRAWRLALLFSLALAAVGRPARADGGDVALGLLAVFGVTSLVAADTVFLIHDINAAASDKHPGAGWAVAELVIASPQALLFNGALLWAEASGKDPDGSGAFLLIPSVWTTTLATHGALATASDTAGSGARFGASAVIAINAGLMSAALGSAIDGEVVKMPLAFTGVVLSVPAVIGSAATLGNAEAGRGAWAALTAWSGASLVYSTAALIYDLRRGALEAPAQSRGGPRYRSFVAAPAVISVGALRGPGIAVGGRF